MFRRDGGTFLRGGRSYEVVPDGRRPKRKSLRGVSCGTRLWDRWLLAGCICIGCTGPAASSAPWVVDLAPGVQVFEHGYVEPESRCATFRIRPDVDYARRFRESNQTSAWLPFSSISALMAWDRRT